MSAPKLWIWIRVPLTAVMAAIDALKERSIKSHTEARAKSADSDLHRAAADRDDEHAEDLKTGVRGWQQGDKPP